MKTKTAGILAAGTLTLAFVFGIASAEDQKKGGLPYHVVERTAADDCIEKKIDVETQKSLEKGEREISFEGAELQAIKDKCIVETGTPMGIFQIITKSKTSVISP